MLVFQWGSILKVPWFAHCHKSVPIMIWHWMVVGCNALKQTACLGYVCGGGSDSGSVGSSIGGGKKFLLLYDSSRAY